MENTLLSSCATPAASASIKAKKMAERGGSVAARFSMSSNDKSFSQVKETRPVNGWNATRICSSQYRSMEELPMTTATLAVPGSTRRMFSTTQKKSIAVALVVSFVESLE